MSGAIPFWVYDNETSPAALMNNDSACLYGGNNCTVVGPNTKDQNQWKVWTRATVNISNGAGLFCAYGHDRVHHTKKDLASVENAEQKKATDAAKRRRCPSNAERGTKAYREETAKKRSKIALRMQSMRDAKQQS
jgi:hypothetical protein